MAGSLNKVQLIGNLGADPDIRTFPDGGKVANLSIATSESWRDRNTGERREKTEWHRVSVRNQGLVGVIEQYTHKGSKLHIEGQLETRKWQDQNGQDRYSTEIVVKGFSGGIILLDSPRNSDQQGNSSGGSSAGQSNSGFGGGSAGQSNSGFGGGQTGGYSRDEMDDDIPF